ncbi:MAG: Gfo/Idh/MocA family oxidoreductase [Sulfuricurvum sp.]|uniref:Gfo/Idh/MocA family protein n=1 Tax=Sulfuricurvum sp. TaxID=2025608 RepID=UPI00262CA710|nr:Gfo/Idh/MocA family oxidoreductase [Sulfuricurvum sp.]MDD5159204.1 Gfo/Idh/MocA family oxidoreductase [Sulfuricurvum sp.]
MIHYKEPLKLAFLGGGIDSAIGYTHYIASQMDHLFVLSAGCFSRRENINKRTAQTWGVEETHLYSDWETLLDNEIQNIDAVVILTPTPDHYKMINKALDLGYSVISEKALATTYEEGLKITEKVNEQKAFFAVTHNYTGYPMLRELQHMIKDNKLGQITNINIEMPQESFARLINGTKPTPQTWRLTDGKIPGVSLDLGTHLQHMVYFLTNENPIELVADQSSFGWFPEVIDNVSCMARYANGMRSQIWYGKSAIGHRNGLRVRIYGRKGSAEWFQMQPEELMFQTLNGDRMIIDRASNVAVSNQLRYNRFKSGHPAGFIEAFGNLYVDIAEKLTQYKIDKNHTIDWSYDALQATKGLEVFEAVKKSTDENRWIKLEDK